MQTKDNRNRQAPVPNNFSDYLTPNQKIALARLNRFGWELKFIRRQLVHEPIVVLGRSNHTFGILERDGRIHDLPTARMRATCLAMAVV